MISLLNNIQNLDGLLAIQVHQDNFYFDINTSGMKTLVKISVYKRYGAVLFKGAWGTIKIISTKTDKTLRIVPQCGTIPGYSTNRVNTVIIGVK